MKYKKVKNRKLFNQIDLSFFFISPSLHFELTKHYNSTKTSVGYCYVVMEDTIVMLIVATMFPLKSEHTL